MRPFLCGCNWSIAKSLGESLFNERNKGPALLPGFLHSSSEVASHSGSFQCANPSKPRKKTQKEILPLYLSSCTQVARDSQMVCCSTARQGTGRNTWLGNRECGIYVQPNPILTKLRSWQFEAVLWGKKGKGEKSGVCVYQKHKRWTVKADVVVWERCGKDFSEQLRICRCWKDTYLKTLKMCERKAEKKTRERRSITPETYSYFHVLVAGKRLQALVS